MARDIEEIVEIYHQRKKRRAPEFSVGADVRDHYNGDVVIPLPELDRNEKPAVANLLAAGLDQTSMRISSTQPDILFAPLRAGFDNQERAAEDRTKCVIGWHDMNELEIKDARKARHFSGYGLASTVIVPDFDRKIPKWELRDPLQTFAAPSSDPDDMTPCDAIFAYTKPLRWLRANYPEAYGRLARRRTSGEPENMDTKFEVIEYIDDEVWVMGVLGEHLDPYDLSVQGTRVEELIRIDNKAGMCTAVIPGRITLDRQQGQFDGMLGMFQQQAMLQALSVTATKKGIFKDEWIVARQGEIPKIVKMANGMEGTIGIVTGGDIKEMPLDPSYMTPQMIDRLEQMQRQEGGIPAQMTGNNPTNVRTGRASDTLLGATIDFTVQEAQRVLARARQHENVRAIAIDKGYWGAKSKSFYVPWDGTVARLDYTPNDLWVSDEHRVMYAHAGVDENARTVEIGQLLGMDLIPKSEARRLHPLIHNPMQAGRDSVKEKIEAALLGGIEQSASQPGANIADFARMAELIDQGTPVSKAILQVQQEAQQRQAPQDAQGNAATVPPGSPEAQPGLAAPGQGAEAATDPTIPPVGPSMQNLSFLLRNFRGEQAAARPQQRVG